MHLIPTLRLTCLVALLALPATVRASSFASSASDAGSASIGSISDSFEGSSDSSTDDDEVAQGDYRIIDVAQAPGREDFVRLKLHSDEAQKEVTLDLPAAVWTKQGLQAGDLVHAQPRPYGFEFARADDGEAFYLVLNEEWYGELAARPLKTL